MTSEVTKLPMRQELIGTLSLPSQALDSAKTRRVADDLLSAQLARLYRRINKSRSVGQHGLFQYEVSLPLRARETRHADSRFVSAGFCLTKVPAARL